MQGWSDCESKAQETSEESEYFILLTKAPLGMKLQTTFYHSVIGVPIKSEEQHFVSMSEKFDDMNNKIMQVALIK